MLINVLSKVAVLLHSSIACAIIERILLYAGWPWRVTFPIVAFWFYRYWKTSNKSLKLFMSQWGRKRQLEFYSGAIRHVFVAGMPESGKKLTIRILVRKTLNWIGHTRKHRAVILDPKQEYLSFLKGMNLSCPVIIANPFDQYSSAWDIAADCNSPAEAREVASIIIPQDGGQNRFFYDAARHIITGVIIGLNKRSSWQWTFRDLIFSLKSSVKCKSRIKKYWRSFTPTSRMHRCHPFKNHKFYPPTKL